MRFDAHAAWINVRRAVLIERLALDAVWKALHHERTILDDRKNHRRQTRVVAEEVALGVIRAWPEHLLQIGNVERVSVGKLQLAVLLALFEVVELCRKAIGRRNPEFQRIAGVVS